MICARIRAGSTVIQEHTMRIGIMIAAIFSALTPSGVFAHPGHGQEGQGYTLVHYLTEPQHFLLLFGAVVAAVLIYRKIRARGSVRDTGQS